MKFSLISRELSFSRFKRLLFAEAQELDSHLRLANQERSSAHWACHGRDLPHLRAMGWADLSEFFTCGALPDGDHDHDVDEFSYTCSSCCWVSMTRTLTATPSLGYAKVILSGAIRIRCDLHLHARALNSMTHLGAEVILAGHTHGSQIGRRDLLKRPVRSSP